MALRQALGGGETAAETHILRTAAVAWLKFRDADEMVATLSRLYELDELHMRFGLLMVIKDACKHLDATLPQKLTQGRSAMDIFLSRGESSEEAAPNDHGPTWPSVAGLPPNEEVDAYHEVLRKTCAGASLIIANPAQQSPFGPAMSFSSLDDLSPVTLNQLLLSKSPVPDRCLRLTVVVSAFMAACVTAIVADSTGQHIRLAVYNTDAKNDADARKILPLGARFALKNPFIKRCNDHWLGLRVDHPEGLVRLGLLPLQPGSRLLVLGDGDLSFSAALARHDRGSAAGGPRAHITATCLDSEEQLLQKYRGAKANVEELRADANVTVLHGVDATKLRRFTRDFCFDKIVWNFPYPIEKTVHSSAEGASLLAEFFGCAGKVLNPGGELRITMASRQGGSTREVAAPARNWDLEALALTHGFDLREVVRGCWRAMHLRISQLISRADANRRCPLTLRCTRATSRDEPSTTRHFPSKAHACTSLSGALLLSRRAAAHRPASGENQPLHPAHATSRARWRVCCITPHSRVL